MSRSRPVNPPTLRVAGALAAISIVLFSLGSCGTEPVRQAPLFIPSPYALIDVSPAWSPDGESIVFHRSRSSSLGPPGVYEVPWTGGQPRLLIAGDAAGPIELDYSPDGSTLVCKWRRDIYLFDIAQGKLEQITFTENSPVHPSWSPDGRYLVYFRSSLVFDQPRDSAGLFLYDTVESRDFPLKNADGDGLVGTQPRWSPLGDRIVYTFDFPATLFLIELDSIRVVRTHRVMAPPPRKGQADPHWLEGGGRLLYSQDGFNSNPVLSEVWSANLDGSAARKFPFRLGFPIAISPDENWVVYRGVDQTDESGSRLVLFIRKLSETAPDEPRQLTFFEEAISEGIEQQ